MTSGTRVSSLSALVCFSAFWWPMLVDDVKWFVRTCHECQIHQTRCLHIPPTVPVIGGLFRKAHLDTMVMPRSAGYQYIVQARCALTAYPEWCMLCSENAAGLASFIFEEILCHWGPLAEIVTDNGPAFVQALDVLANRYQIRHIRISPYNSQANSVVEQRHFDVRKAIIKSNLGGSLAGMQQLTWSSGPSASLYNGLLVCLPIL